MTKDTKAQDASDAFESARQAILKEALKIAAFEGWTDVMLRSAVREAGIDAPTAKAALPSGARDLLRYWSEETDRQMADQMRGDEFAALKIREKVRFAVWSRLEIIGPHKEAARRAAALLALPHNHYVGASLNWRTADCIWRGLGDTSTDFNFYSKRAILSGVLLSTTARWFADDTPEAAATGEFLDARIENVMGIEKAKAQLKKLNLDPTGLVSALGRLRYRGEA